MANKNRFFDHHHRRRWSRFLKWELDALNMSPTRLATEIGETTARVSQWLRGDRGVEPSTAWRVGEILARGKRRTALEFLWGAGYFDDVVAVLAQIAANESQETQTLAMQLFAALPNAMHVFEAKLCNDLYIVGGKPSEELYRDDRSRILAMLVEYDDDKRNRWWAHRGVDDPITFARAILDSDAAASVVSECWNKVLRGSPCPELSSSLDAFDADVANAAIKLGEVWMSRFVPTIVGVRMWRILGEAFASMRVADMTENVPLEYLPVSTADALGYEESAWMDVMASEAAYDSYRGK